jgi:energy-coupling factor transporter ATP-binding protein EcfA2
MANFDFSTLNSSDLENLVCSILNAKEQSERSKIIFKIFKDGKDKGIDILYSTPGKDYDIVGQVKHYYRSGYKKLIQHIKASEKQKVVKLSPNKYLFATSVDLSVDNTKEIKEAFKPYLKSLSDIYGKKELNHYLDRFPNLVTQQFKLWYSTTEVLQLILNYQVVGRSNEFLETEFKRKLRLYVETPALTKCREVIEKNNFIIITGEPGVGKTSTAELLLYYYIKDNYELTYIYDDIKEAEKILDQSQSAQQRKQIFYFDDFLGHNSVEIQKAKGSETAFLKILKRISVLENKKFIFTTRTFMLRTVVEESEKLRRFNLLAKESIISLDIYDQQIRSQLLKNHIEESELSDEHKMVLQKKELQAFIVNHINFSPRSVEYITSFENCQNFSVQEYENFIRNNFNKPDEIWRHAYEQQISVFERLLLNTMLSFGDSVHLKDLEHAYNARVEYEVKFNNYEKPLDAYRSSFRKLEGGFITQETYDLERFKFINPSLVDFLLNYLKNNKEEVIRISNSACYLSQLTTRIYSVINYKHLNISPYLKQRLLQDYQNFINSECPNNDRLILAIFLTQYFEFVETERIANILLSEIDDWSFLNNIEIGKYTLYDYLKNLDSNDVIEILSKYGLEIFSQLILDETDLGQVIILINEIAPKFRVDLKLLFQMDDEYNFSQHFTELLEEKIEEDIEDLLSYSNAQDFVTEKETETSEILDQFNSFGLNVSVNLSNYSRYDWWEIGTENYFNEQMQKDD